MAAQYHSRGFWVGAALVGAGALTLILALLLRRTAAAPDIVFTRTRQDPLRVPVENSTLRMTIHFTQLWFQNVGTVPAPSITATLEVTQDGITVFTYPLG